MKVVLGLLAALCGLIAVVGGFGVGLGMVAYSIYLVVLMIKGTLAVTFFGILKVVACWVMAGLCGWLWGMLWGFLATLFAGGASH